MSSTPVWTWPSGASDPVLAGQVSIARADRGDFVYDADYLRLDKARSLDPIQLRLGKSPKRIPILGDNGLPGVINDAMPAGYGADVIMDKAGSHLDALRLLELGPNDAVGALVVCEDIERKLAWKPHSLEDLQAQLDALDAQEPSSRAIRRMALDDGTSAGGERPKVTLAFEGAQWMAKLQARGDIASLPAKEFVVMRMAGDLGLRVPNVKLIQRGRHEVFMVERFDRSGDPLQPQRHLFASAYTLGRLKSHPLPGAPERSYLVLADRMRSWIKDETALRQDLQELWRRMAYNALVGNKDDHPRNHGLVHDGTGWRLSSLFDVTPLATFSGLLAMGVLADGSQDCSPANLLSVAHRFELDLNDAAQWLSSAARVVASNWQERMRDAGIEGPVIAQVEPAFALASEMAEGSVEQALLKVQSASRPRRR